MSLILIRAKFKSIQSIFSNRFVFSSFSSLLFDSIRFLLYRQRLYLENPDKVLCLGVYAIIFPISGLASIILILSFLSWIFQSNSILLIFLGLEDPILSTDGLHTSTASELSEQRVRLHRKPVRVPCRSTLYPLFRMCCSKCFCPL